MLHTSRCIGSATTQRLEAAVTPLDALDVEGELLALAAQGLVAHGSGEFGGWQLTDAGRIVDAERVASELDHVGARATVRGAYDDFLLLNPRVLDICGAWQLRTVGEVTVLNDHTDHRYDRRVLDELEAVYEEARPACDLLAACLHRFSSYGPRLARALRRARHGERDLVSDSMDPYHSVWFQLHEDLLVTLGIPRGSRA